jgi:chemotaxis protein methyltransferase CheR
MESDISHEQLARFSDFIAEAMGLHYPPARWIDLQRGISTVARELGFESIAECTRWLMSAPLTKQQIEALAASLTVGETYFMRERRSFDVLSDHILPGLIRARQFGERRLRIWSAACCTGEEAYSIAILLRRMMLDCQDWNVTLLATDINSRFLERAEAGIFGQWSFRDAPPWLTQYFKIKSDGQFAILPEIKRMVHFAQLNLASDAYPSLANDTNAMDVIFCRNVLMYFTVPQAKRVLQNLYRAQADGGWLIIGSSELPHGSSSAYRTVSFEEATVYQKADSIAQPSAPPVASYLFESSCVETMIDKTPQTRIVPIEIAQDSSPVSAPQPIKVEHSQSPNPYADALVLYQQGFYAEAAQKLKESSSGPHPDPQVLCLLARSLANQGNLVEALDYCDQWIAADKLNASSHYLRALILQEQGATAKAVQSLHCVLYLDPGFVLAHFALGKNARDGGNWPDAERHLNNALRLSRAFEPDDVLPESEGITAARFAETIMFLINTQAVA